MTPNENLDEESAAEVDATPAAETPEEAEPDEVAEEEPLGIDEALATLEPEVEQSSSKSSAFMGVPIEIVVSVGKARPLVSELVKLRRDSVITLDSKIDDPVEIFIGERLIARGELQEIEEQEGKLGVRLTEVADLSNGV